MSQWIIFDTGIQSAEENMRLDTELLEKAETFFARSFISMNGQGRVLPMVTLQIQLSS